jgi:transposase InsO family protein
MYHVQVDLLVGLPSSKEASLYPKIYLHTGYLWLHPLTTKGAAEVAQALMKIRRQFGPIKVLHTDNGKEFKNKLMAKITDYAKIQLRFGSSYHKEQSSEKIQSDAYLGKSARSRSKCLE